MTPTRIARPFPPSGAPALSAADAGLCPRALAAVLNGTAVDAAAPALDVAPGQPEPPRAAPGEAPSSPDHPLAPPSLRAGIAAKVGTARLIVFRVGSELFAAELALVEEVVEPDGISSLPGMSGAVLGVVRVRDHSLPMYSPAAALGVPLAAPAAVLVTRRGARLVAIGVDAVEGVLEVGFDAVRPPPFGDEMVLAVVWRAGDIVTVVDWAALVDACIAGRAMEGA
jgi:chemotaxis signal transduction protein